MKDIIKLIKITRDDINLYLRTRRNSFSEETLTYVYPNDLSGRLTALQAIAGNFSMHSNEVKNLWDLLQDSNQINQANLSILIKKLAELLKPIEHFPPMKEKLQNTIDKASHQLAKAYLMLKFSEKVTYIKNLADDIDTTSGRQSAIDFLKCYVHQLSDDVLNMHQYDLLTAWIKKFMEIEQLSASVKQELSILTNVKNESVTLLVDSFSQWFERLYAAYADGHNIEPGYSAIEKQLKLVTESFSHYKEANQNTFFNSASAPANGKVIESPENQLKYH